MHAALADTSTSSILTLDIGTLSVRAFIYDINGHTQGFASRNIKLYRLNDTHIEQDPREIKTAAVDVLNEMLAFARENELQITAAGLSTQRSSVIAWDRETGRPLSDVLSWQDRRAASYLQPLQKKSKDIKQVSGLVLSPHYGASKLRWMLDHNIDLAQKESSGQLIFGPLAAFVIYHLVHSHPMIVDHVNASRTQLLDLETRNWSTELLANFNLRSQSLPECRPTQSTFGHLINTEIPLTAVNGDQNAAIHGLGKLEEGTFITNIGTGAFVLLPTGKRPIHHPRLLTSIANSNDDNATYLLEGTVNGAGAALQWAAEQWGITDLSHHLEQWISNVESPPIFVNTIGGLGSPLWEEGPAPYFTPEGGTTAEKAVAIVESIIFLIKINLDAMIDTGQAAKRIRISGGLSEIDGLCQLLADLSNRLVVRSEVRQTTSRGIAWLAASPQQNWNNYRDDYFIPKSNRALRSRYKTFCALLGWRPH